MGVKIAKNAKNVTGVKEIAAELENKCIDKTQFTAPSIIIPMSNIE